MMLGQILRQTADRRLIEKRDEHNRIIEQSLHRTCQSHRGDRISAEIKKIIIDADTVIWSIGQRPDLSFVESEDVPEETRSSAAHRLMAGA